MKVRDILKKLEADGWYEARMKGSHRVLKHPEKSGIVVVPGNFSDEVAIALQVSGNKHNWSQNNERICSHF